MEAGVCWVGRRAEVIAIATQRGGKVTGGAACADTDGRAVSVVIQILVPSGAPAGAFFINKAIAVIIDSITYFCSIWIDISIAVIAITAVRYIANRLRAGGGAA